MKKLCYIIPEYRHDAHTHFAYLLPFVRKIAKDRDVLLIVLAGETPPFFEGKTMLCAAKSPFLRLIKMKIAITRAYFGGYRDFYVHYSFFAAFIASVIGRLFGGRVFYWNCGEPWKYRRNLLRRFGEYLVYQFITYLVTGTEGMRAQYATHYKISPKKIKVMPNWIDIANLKNQISKVKSEDVKKELHAARGSKVVFFAHRLSRRKGAHHLPEILKGLKDREAVLVIAGDGPEKQHIQSVIDTYQLHDRVRFLGWVQHELMLRYMAAADVFIMPSEEEGFPHVILETMAIGTPFVAFDVGGVREITSPDFERCVVPAQDILQFTSRLDELLTRKSMRKEFQKTSDQWIRQYDIGKVVAQFMSMVN